MPAMPVVLAIETSAHIGAVALLDSARPEAAIGEVVGDDHKLAGWLLPAIGRLLQRAGPSAPAIDAIAFGAGPGSFTGVRTACATAQALAFGWQKPLLAVDSLQALAMQAAGDAAHATIAVALDARMGEVYVASFAADGTSGAASLQRLSATTVQRPDAVRLPEAALLVGSGARLIAAAQPGLKTAIADDARTVASEREWAIGVARVAAAMLARGETVDPRTAEPIYVRNKVALTEAERALQRGAPNAAAATAAATA